MNSNTKTQTETFRIPWILMVRISRKVVVFYGISMKECIVDALPADNEDNIYKEVSEATVMEI